MSEPLLNYADLLLRIVKLEARVIQLEQQNSRRAAPMKWLDIEVEPARSPHWVCGEPGGSGTK